MTRRWGGVIAVALLAGLSTTTESAGPRPAATSVSIDGTVVTIRVPIEIESSLQGHPTVIDLKTGERIPAGPYLEGGAERIWNEGLARLRYRECLTFKIDVDITFIERWPDVPVPLSDRHRITLSLHPDQVTAIYDTATDDPNEDTTSAYTGLLFGAFGQIGDVVFAHELGHLLGLGDDYKGSGRAPGRDAGLMALDELSITQDYVDRIGTLLDSLAMLPECWKGTMDSDTTRAYQGLGSCADSWKSSLTFTIDGKGEVSGEGVASLVSGPVCFVPGPSGPYASKETFSITGTANEQAIRLKFGEKAITIEPSNGGVVAGFHAMYAATFAGETIEISRTSPCAAREHVVIARTDLDVAADLHTSTNDIDLECTSEGG